MPIRKPWNCLHQYIRPPVALPWTRDEEAIFLAFEGHHIVNTPWPTEAMDFFSRKYGLDCRAWTQKSLFPEVLAERARIEAQTGVKKVWDPNYFSEAGQPRAAVSLPMTVDEEALFREVQTAHLPGELWPVREMNQVSLERSLNCRKWTPQAVRQIAQNELEMQALLEEKLALLQKEEALLAENEDARATAEREEPIFEDTAEESERYDSGNGGGSERGWISGEDESRKERSQSI